MKRTVELACILITFSNFAHTSVTLVARKMIFPNQSIISDKRPGIWAVVAEYSQNFDYNSITCLLFGRAILPNTRTLPVSGSAVSNRRLFDWFADYFGLPPDFQSNVTFTLQVKNVVIDNSLLTTLPIIPGAFIRIDMTFIFTSWGMHMREHVINAGVQGYQAGYFTPGDVNRAQLLNCFTDYITGCSSPQLSIDPRLG